MTKCKIVGEKLFLRPLSQGDLPLIVKWSHDKEISLLTDGGYPDSLTEAAQWFAELSVNRQARAMMICLADGTPIGNLELAEISWRTGEAEVRIRIGERDFWDQGWGAEALNLLLEIAFNKMRLQSLYLRVYSFNQRAIHCYSKVGFKPRGSVCYGIRGQEKRELMLMTIKKKQYLKKSA
jgi:RimJ/RimL family protein N-acetyltransferase